MTVDQTPLVIWGTGGHAVSVLETAVAAGIQDITFVSQESGLSEFEDHPCIQASHASTALAAHRIVIAIGDNSARQRTAEQIQAVEPTATFATLIHPSATVARSATLGEGTVVLQGAIIGAKAQIGTHCIVNTGAILDHECVLGDFVSLAPRVVTGGRVQVGSRSAIGIGAAVRHNVAIGSDTVVGSASYVHSDMPDGVVAYGTPARVFRQRNGNDPYLS